MDSLSIKTLASAEPVLTTLRPKASGSQGLSELGTAKVWEWSFSSDLPWTYAPGPESSLHG